MTIKYHHDLIQGSAEWLEARRGIITASEMHLIMTPTGKPADNEKSRVHLWELVAQRVTGRIEPQYVSDAMLRGMEDEAEARALYAEHVAQVDECGFVSDNRFGFPIGYSPDGLVGDGGLIEIKSRTQKYHAQTIARGVVPDEYLIQIQTGLLLTRRMWCDFISFCCGMPMIIIRVHPDVAARDKILNAANRAVDRMIEMEEAYRTVLKSGTPRTIPTIYRDRGEMII